VERKLNARFNKCSQSSELENLIKIELQGFFSKSSELTLKKEDFIFI
jgi:hypothetical protein